MKGCRISENNNEKPLQLDVVFGAKIKYNNKKRGIIMKVRKGGRRAIVLTNEIKNQLFADYDNEILTVQEIMLKYNISRYMFYKTMRERRRNESNA